jgi:uncharacterized membrane protein
VECRHFLWHMICGLLVALPLSGCDYGDRNRDPLAENDAAITARGVPVTIDARVNDADPDGDPLTLVAWTQGGNGEVIGDNGLLTYTPNEGFDGSDSFTYTIDDEHGGQGTATVTVTVLPDPGVVVDGTLYTVRAFVPEGLLDAAAWGVNDQGQVAGSGLAGDGSEIAFFLDGNGALTAIELPSAPGSAFGINNNGLIAGVFFTPVDHEEASVLGLAPQQDEHGHNEEEELFGQSFLWDANARSLVALYQIVGASATLGFKVNDAGQVVGQVEFPVPDDEEGGEGEDHEHDDHERMTLGFIRQVDGTTSTFSVPGVHNTFVSGINNSGQIVGGFTADAGAGTPRIGFLRHVDGTLTTFNVPDENGAPLPTQAEDINDAGVIVGYFLPEAHAHEPAAEPDHEGEEEAVLPFLRKVDGTIFRFSLPNALQARFSDINNRGVISGFSVAEDGVRQALLLTPVQPAPQTFFRDTPAEGDDHDHDH